MVLFLHNIPLSICNPGGSVKYQLGNKKPRPPTKYKFKLSYVTSRLMLMYRYPVAQNLGDLDCYLTPQG